MPYAWSEDSFMESVLASTCTGVPGIELRLSSLHSKHLYPLSHHTGPLLLCLLRVGNTFLPSSWTIKESNKIVVVVLDMLQPSIINKRSFMFVCTHVGQAELLAAEP